MASSPTPHKPRQRRVRPSNLRRRHVVAASPSLTYFGRATLHPRRLTKQFATSPESHRCRALFDAVIHTTVSTRRADHLFRRVPDRGIDSLSGSASLGNILVGNASFAEFSEDGAERSDLDALLTCDLRRELFK